MTLQKNRKVNYKTIVIDFPWNVKNNFDPKKVGYGRKMPYELMSNDEIMNFDINHFTQGDCDLFMWVTHTTLPLGLKILEQWGFNYHALITWDKTRGVTMLGLHRNSEMCLYAYRGHMGLKQKGKSINTVFRETRKRHSEKPQTFYSMILPNTKEPRIDIFARKKHIGFDAYGNEVDNTLTLEHYA